MATLDDGIEIVEVQIQTTEAGWTIATELGQIQVLLVWLMNLYYVPDKTVFWDLMKTIHAAGVTQVIFVTARPDWMVLRDLIQIARGRGIVADYVPSYNEDMLRQSIKTFTS
jgi:hypothetical protein